MRRKMITQGGMRSNVIVVYSPLMTPFVSKNYGNHKKLWFWYSQSTKRLQKEKIHCDDLFGMCH